MIVFYDLWITKGWRKTMGH